MTPAPQGCKGENFYAIFTRIRVFSTPFLRAQIHTDDLINDGFAHMDFFYLLLLVLLIGATAGFLRLCVRLEDRK